MTDWQDISTAPKDGTQFLVWLPNDEPQIAVAYWAGFEGESWLAYAESLIGDVVGAVTEPTHWMPLPAPPAQGGA